MAPICTNRRNNKHYLASKNQLTSNISSLHPAMPILRLPLGYVQPRDRSDTVLKAGLHLIQNIYNRERHQSQREARVEVREHRKNTLPNTDQGKQREIPKVTRWLYAPDPRQRVEIYYSVNKKALLAEKCDERGYEPLEKEGRDKTVGVITAWRRQKVEWERQYRHINTN